MLENCQLGFVIIVAILNLVFVSCLGKLLAAAKLFDRMKITLVSIKVHL